MNRIYVTYLRSMTDSPEVTDYHATTDLKEAQRRADALQKEIDENEWNEEDGNDTWAESCMSVFEADLKAGDKIHLSVVTEWIEAVETYVNAHFTEQEARAYIEKRKTELLADNPKLVLDYEDESPQLSIHLYDDGFMEDCYLDLVTLTIE